MDTRSRTQSVAAFQAPPNQSRTSKVFQRVSNITGRLRFPGRKPRDDPDMNPYPTQTRSMDMYGETNVKPYMSHPALNTVVKPLGHRYRHSESSSSSVFPSHSPSKSEPRTPVEVEELPQPTHSYTQSTPFHPVPAALIPGMRTGATLSNRSMDRTPFNAGSWSQPLLRSTRPFTPTGISETKQTPEIVISDPTESPPQTQYVSRPSISDAQTTKKLNETSNTSLSLDRVPIRSLSQTRLKSLPSIPSEHPPTTSSQVPAYSTVSLPPPPDLRHATITYASSPALPQVVQAQSPTPPSLRPAMFSYTSYPPQTQPAAQPGHQSDSPAVHILNRSPRPPPKLSLRAVNRLNQTMPDGYSARFSPSIVMRTPPVPMRSLPPLPAIPSEPSSSGTRQNMVGLSNMPELPRHGTDQPDDGDGDDDDEGDDDDDDGQENDSETLRDGNSSINLDFNNSDEHHIRPVENDAGVDLKPSLSSLKKAHSESSSDTQDAYLGLPEGLPEVNTSRIDIDFSFPPASSAVDLKGKGKARSSGPDTERTPTPGSVQHDYFSDLGMEKKRERGRDLERFGAKSESAQSQSESSEHARKDTSVSPTLTPRGGNMSVRMLSPPAPSASAPGSVSPKPPSQNSVATLSNCLSRSVDVNGGLYMYSGMYKHASRSLIDIHAAEKKEMVEEMVRDAEQEAILEEKERRRRSVMISGKGKGKGRELVIIEAHNPGTCLEPPLPPPSVMVHGVEGEGTNPKGISKAPAYEAGPPRLRRRRSMPSFIAISDPPPYPAFERGAHAHGLSAQLHIQPRDDEGRERLPTYSNDIYLKSIVPLKMEFVAAGVQAKDRKWRRVVCVLEGTVLKVYRCPANVAGVSALGGWWERKVGVGDVSIGDAATGSGGGGAVAERAREEELVRERVRMSKGGNGNGQTELQVPESPPVSSSPLQRTAHTPLSSSRSMGLANLFRPGRTHARSTSDVQTALRPQSSRASLHIPLGASGSDQLTPSFASTLSVSSHNSYSASTSSSQSHLRNVPHSNSHGSSETAVTPEPEPNPADLIRAYTLQNAESGLGNDYLKRKNVIRFRVDGEQFLFQAKDAADVVRWIEGLQAAANISLDLDKRPMPKGPLFPRRRRRRGARRPGTEADPIGPLDGSVNIALSRDQ